VNTSPLTPLQAIFKAYDIRGLIDGQITPEITKAIGAAYATFVATPTVVVARDMRESGVELAAAFAAGVNSVGVDVIDIGLASTDLMYFASGRLDIPGAMFTASHNPAAYNGIKMCLAGAKPIGEDTGLFAIRDLAQEFLDGTRPYGTATGAIRSMELLNEFADHALNFVDWQNIRGLTIVADTANGMGGLVVPAVLGQLDVKLDILFGELDGSFPNHPADPIQPENLRDLQKRVVATRADIGLAFDGDADRVFLVDEKGQPVSGSTTTAMLAASILAKYPGSKVIYNLICSKSVPDVIRENGGEPVRTRVGHSFIKDTMATTGAVFGGEHSAHYYFRDNWRADSGLIAALHVLEMMAQSGKKLSELRIPFERFAASGEINTKVENPALVIERIEAAFASKATSMDHLDGLTVDFGSWWFNLRASNTEPLLRLNLEAANEDDCTAHTADIVSLIAGLASTKS
jgi:phosphomannomutase